MSTFLGVQTRVFDKLDEKRKTTGRYSVSKVSTAINEEYVAVCGGEVKSLINPKQKFVAGDLRFLKKSFGINLNVSTLTTAIITVGDTTISCDTTNLQSASVGSPKYVAINEQVIKYTDKTSTTLTGVTGIVINIPSGAVVKQVYKLPSDFDRRIGLQYVKDTNSYLIYRDQRGQRPDYRHYTIMSDSFTTDQEYIYINGYNSSQDAFLFWYYMKPTELSADGDEFVLPGDRAEKILGPLVAGRMLLKDEPNTAAGLLTEGYAHLEALYSKYGNRDAKFRQKVRVAPMQGIEGYNHLYNLPLGSH